MQQTENYLYIQNSEANITILPEFIDVHDLYILFTQL